MTQQFRMVVFFVLVIAFAGFSTGCSTLADAKMAKGKGRFKVYDATSQEAWDAVKKAIVSVGLQYVGENLEEHYILAQRGMSAFSYGENVAIFVESIDEHKTRIEIVSKRSMSTNILAPNWTNKLFSAIAALIKPIEQS